MPGRVAVGSQPRRGADPRATDYFNTEREIVALKVDCRKKHLVVRDRLRRAGLDLLQLVDFVGQTVEQSADPSRVRQPLNGI